MQRQIEKLKQLEAYHLIKQSKIEELSTTAVIMEHKKTKARILLILAEDKNKVFTIGFRTPPTDSTGVAHIVEHTVLCGSKKFPSKDPFVELVKGSLNTFLNAMTYPDKTLYPVASCNDKDFQNLCDVYLDAVFHPNIYREEKIFRQEGWHFEMESPESDLIYNGVVYNEMKGVYSSADGILERSVSKTLFEGHTYGEESGGDPECIPDLTYEDYLDFHRRYYHPSNSFIYFYGDMDMAEKLEWLDREYLSEFDYLFIDSAVPTPKPWTSPREVHFDYPISEAENEQKSTYLSVHTVVGGELDPVKMVAMQTLSYVLLDMPGAPLREALIEAGIGEDILGGYEYGIKEPYFSVIAKNAREEEKDEFLHIVKDALRKLAGEGLDKEVLRAAINMAEFKAREADFGSYPKGLLYGLETFNSWLYDADPCMHLRFQEIFDQLKKEVDTDYFEKLIKDLLLENPYEAVIILHPVKNLDAQNEKKLADKLAAIKAGLSKEEIERIVRETKELKIYQAEPSSKEDMEKIPMLRREEIGREAEKLIWEKKKMGEISAIHSDIFTTGIAYIRMVFGADFVEKEELPYLGFLKEVLGYIDTKEYSYANLSTNINLNSGGLGFNVDSYPIMEDVKRAKYTFGINVKVLYDKIGWAFSMAKEIALHSKLGDKKRLKDIALEVKARTKSRLLSAGHITALTRAGADISKDSYFADATRGITYYRFLEDLTANFDEKADQLVKVLVSLTERLFTRDNLLLDVICDGEGYQKVEENVNLFVDALETTAKRSEGFVFVPSIKREAFTSASMVNYVARYGNFRNHGFQYTGVLKILKVLLSYDYLWNHIRVQGGAYGCMAVFGRTGNAGFTSYRDPKLMETDAVYDGIVDYVKNYTANEREMTKAVIGAISELDTPLTPLSAGLLALSAYYTGVSDEDLQRERNEILNCKVEDIRALAPLLEAVLSDGAKTAVGNAGLILANKEAFTEVEALFND